MEVKKRYLELVYLTVSITISLSISALMVYVAIDHNPQGEFCSYLSGTTQCEYQLGSIASVFFGWFFVTFFALSLPAFALRFLAGMIRWFKSITRR